MTREQLYNKIESYLNNELDSTAKSAFEQEMAKDRMLAKEVQLHQQLQEELADTDKLALRNKLKTIVNASTPTAASEEVSNNKTDSGNSYWKWIVPLLFLLAGAYFIFPSQKEETVPSINPNPTQKETPTTIPTPEEKKIEEEIGIPKEEWKNIPQANNAPKKTKESTVSTPPPKQIAAIDEKAFLPNSHLEDQLNVGFRGEGSLKDVEMQLTDGKIARTNGKATIQIKGISTEQADYQLTIYSNKPDDYINEKTILTSPLSLQPKDENFEFSFNANIPLQPALYYFVIALADDDEPLKVGKFEVK